MEATTRVVPGADGTMIRVEEFGESGGKPLLVHPGSPGSRRLFRPDAELAAREFGLRLLSYDRPGYGGRPRRKGRRVAGAVTDVRCIASALGIERMGVWGFSGGGPYALACAALLPGLVTASTPEGWMARWVDAAGTDDARSWEVACHLAAGVRDSLADGDDGWRDDWVAILTPWGCDPTTTRVRVRLWHGARDRGVPVAHGRWLAAHVPGIGAHIPELEDHTNIEHNHKATAYAWLSGLA